MGEKETLIFRAKLAEQAERFDGEYKDKILSNCVHSTDYLEKKSKLCLLLHILCLFYSKRPIGN